MARMNKLLFVAAFFIALVALSLVDIAYAQNNTQISVSDVFSWASSSPPDWNTGGLYAGLGFVGALVVIFGLIGGAVPGTAGQAKIDEDLKRRDNYYKILDELVKSPNPDKNHIDQEEKVNKAIESLTNNISREKWRQFTIAAILYVVLGAFFATFLAKDLIQAIVIGATWTGFIGVLGIKSDSTARQDKKDAALNQLVDRIKEQDNHINNLKAFHAGKAAQPLELSKFDLSEADIAASL